MALRLPTVQAIRDALNRNCGQYKSNLVLAYDILAVALGIRTGLLIDSISIDEKKCRLLSNALFKLSGPFENLQVIYEPESSQTFIVNLRLIYQQSLVEVVPPVLDVSGLEPILLKSSYLHGSLISLISLIQNQTTTPPKFLLLELPPNTSPSILISLAGWILEYPLIYYLSNSNSDKNCLGGRELWVFKLTLGGKIGESIPLSIVIDKLGGQDELRQSLLFKFNERLREAKLLYRDTTWNSVLLELELVEMERFSL